MKRLVLPLLLSLSFPSNAGPNPFVGQWEVTQVVDTKEYAWSAEVKYPKRMTLELKNGELTGSYTDQYEHSCAFPLVSLINDGNELVLANCGPTKDPSAYAPLHRVRLTDGKLRGVAMTNKVLFVWTAERRK
jgi:hypothetical protein